MLSTIAYISLFSPISLKITDNDQTEQFLRPGNAGLARVLALCPDYTILSFPLQNYDKNPLKRIVMSVIQLQS